MGKTSQPASEETIVVFEEQHGSLEAADERRQVEGMEIAEWI